MHHILYIYILDFVSKIWVALSRQQLQHNLRDQTVRFNL